MPFVTRDFPRLVSLFQVIDSHGNNLLGDLKSSQEWESGIAGNAAIDYRIMTMLSLLCDKLGDQVMARMVDQHIQLFLDTKTLQGMTGFQLSKFFEQCDGKEGRLIGLLKACHQDIIAPAVKVMATPLMTKHKVMLKDPKQDEKTKAEQLWQILIEFDEVSGAVGVTHTKKMESINMMSPRSPPEFSMVWELTITWLDSKRMDHIEDVVMGISVLSFSDEVSEQRKAEILETLHKYLIHHPSSTH